MKSKKHLVFTSVNFNYLGRALTLARSVKKHSPEIHFVLLLVEPDFIFTPESKAILLGCDEGNTIDEILTLDELNLIQNELFRNYSVVEMCTAVKGQAVVDLLARGESEYVTYLDPDLYFYNPLAEIRKEHLNGDVLLTPHLNHVPFRNQIIYNDEIAGVLRHGIFNLGFVSFKNTKPARDIAAWWADRLQISSKADYANGLFTDQKWWDLSQVYFDDTFVVKNDGWNMAPWNVSERRLVSVEPPQLDSGQSLLFFHFSKFPSPDFDNKVQAQSKSVLLKNLINDYSEQFNISQKYAEEIISNLNQREQVAYNRVTLTPKRKPKIERTLSKFLEYVVSLKTIRNFVASSPILISIARRVFAKMFSLIYRVEKHSMRDHFDLSTRDITLDLLLFTHSGGGGVSVVVADRISHYLNAGKTVGVINGNQNGDPKLVLKNLNREISISGNLHEILSNSQEVEIHHLLGLEAYIGELLVKKVDRIFLHDKYLITQMPFADTEKFIRVPRNVLGINIALNGDSKYVEGDWRELTRKLLNNTIEVLAPSNYIINEYQQAFPSVKIKKFELEPSLEFPAKSKQSRVKRSIVLISPTGLHKGSSVLIDVAKQLQDSYPLLSFHVYGDLELSTQESLRKLNNVTLVEQLSRPRLNHALSNSYGAIGWIPSLTGESYSLALSDFLSNGMTVISSNSGALSERLREVPGNYLYDPGISSRELAEVLVAICENQLSVELNTHLECT